MDNKLMENTHVQGNKANYDWLMESKAQLEAGVPFDRIKNELMQDADFKKEYEKLQLSEK